MKNNNKKNKQPKVVRQPDFKNYYANNSRVKFSENEIQIRFGIMDEADDNPGVMINYESCNIILTPGYAKNVANALTHIMSIYEKQFGELKPAEEPLMFDDTEKSS